VSVRVRTVRLAVCLALIAVLAALAGCGGGSEESDDPGGSGGPQAVKGSADALDKPPVESPDDFVERFERFTGVPLKPVKGDLSGIRLEVPLEPSRFTRFGAYAMLWTRDDEARRKLLGSGSPDGDGIYWEGSGSSFTAVKPFGSRLVLRWIGRPQKQTTIEWDRLERAIEAAIGDDEDKLDPAERPCEEAEDPVSGEAGECAVNGIPMTFVDAGDELSTPALRARVLGVDTAARLSSKGLAPLVANGRFLLIAYRVVNEGSDPIRFVQPQLELDGQTLAESPEASFLLPRKGSLPLAPGATLEARAAFDLPASGSSEAGTLVLPAERNGSDDPSLKLHRGLIRLAGAPMGLPKAAGGPRASG
ncbi:MAG: hypothetical protein ACR2GL_00005, partial [Thermoleophilaceae bacterium]